MFFFRKGPYPELLEFLKINFWSGSSLSSWSGSIDCSRSFAVLSCRLLSHLELPWWTRWPRRPSWLRWRRQSQQHVWEWTRTDTTLMLRRSGRRSATSTWRLRSQPKDTWIYHAQAQRRGSTTSLGRQSGEKKSGGHGEGVFFRVLLWSRHWLRMWKWPPVGWHRKAWTEERDLARADMAGGSGAMWLPSRRDLDCSAKTLRLRTKSAIELCVLCPACFIDMVNPLLRTRRVAAIVRRPYSLRASFDGCQQHVHRDRRTPHLAFVVPQYFISSVLACRQRSHRRTCRASGRSSAACTREPTRRRSTTIFGLVSLVSPDKPTENFPCLQGKRCWSEGPSPCNSRSWIWWLRLGGERCRHWSKHTTFCLMMPRECFCRSHKPMWLWVKSTCSWPSISAWLPTASHGARCCSAAPRRSLALALATESAIRASPYQELLHGRGPRRQR